MRSNSLNIIADRCDGFAMCYIQIGRHFAVSIWSRPTCKRGPIKRFRTRTSAET